jgi:leader peptidase (prepilin peptidase) / N-methyltransferase
VIAPSPLVLAFVFLVGAVIGSFLNVCIARWPRELSVVRPRSRCPHCGYRIQWFENIPLLSWIALRGRCRCCEEAISMMYPTVELLVGLGWMISFWHFGVSIEALRVAVFGTLLLGISVTDAKHYLIPDGFTLFGVFWVLSTSSIVYLLAQPSIFAEPYEALIGACAGAGLIAIVGWLGERALKKEAMGFGDVTLMAFIGGAVGPGRAIVTVFLGALIGSVVFLAVVYPIAWMRRSHYQQQTELALGGASFEPPSVPFGVFLAPAALLTLFWGDALLAWVLRS